MWYKQKSFSAIELPFNHALIHYRRQFENNIFIPALEQLCNFSANIEIQSSTKYAVSQVYYHRSSLIWY